jgi:heat shock protein HtpX
MWELIRANKRKSLVLFIAMGACLLLLGYSIGATWLGPNGGTAGIVIASTIWFFMSLASYFSGDSILLATSKAHLVSKDMQPQLFNVVEEMKIAAGLPSMPKVYIIHDPAPNAFATGRKLEDSSVAVTAGLLGRLNRDELQGVVAHEMSHIANRDVLFMTLAGVMLGGIVMISQVFFRSMWFSSGSSRRYRGGGRGGGQAQLVFLVLALGLAILAPIVARLLYFAVSREREYLADASAARLTRYPEGLASALEKISDSNLDLASANKATAPMYIVNPLKEKGKKLADLTSTHPPISERIRILRSMMGGAGYTDYQEAYFRVKGKGSVIIPRSGLSEKETVEIRKPSVVSEKAPTRKKGIRQVGDLMRALNKYAFLVCACGLKMKIPPDFKKSQIPCPRCGRKLEVPVAELATLAAASQALATPAGEVRAEKTATSSQQVYTRKGQGWESFSCQCGRLVQLSPGFVGPNVRCKDCGRIIEIKS